jgi:hypothetical protein
MVPFEDAVALLAIASRAVRVQQSNGYSGPFTPVEDNEPFIDTLSLQDVDFGPQAAKPNSIVEPPPAPSLDNDLPL